MESRFRQKSSSGSSQNRIRRRHKGGRQGKAQKDGKPSSAAPKTKRHSEKFLKLSEEMRKTKRHSEKFLKLSEEMRKIRSTEEINTWLREKVHGNGPLRPHDQPAFIRELAQRKAYDAIPFYVKNLSDQSVFVYTTAISAMAKGFRNSSTVTPLQLLDEMDNVGVRPTNHTFTAVLQSIDGAKGVTKFLQRIRNHYGVTKMGVEVYNAAINACCRGPGKDDWQKALRLYFELKKEGIKPDQKTFSCLIRCCAKASQLRVALSLLWEMKQTMVPNERVWGAALHACAQVGDYRESMKLLKEMQAMGIKPTTFHVTSLFSALSKSRQHDLSMRLLESMQIGRSVTIPLGRTGQILTLDPVSFDLVAVNSVLYGCGRDGNYEMAKALLDRLNDGEFFVDADSGPVPLQPDEISYNAVLAACRDPKEAKLIVREMRYSRRHRRGATPPTSITYTHAITACRRADPPDLDTALELLRWADDDALDLHVYTYSAAIWTAETCGKPDIALDILNRLRRAGLQPNAVCFLGVMSALAAEGRADDAVSLLWEMKVIGTELNENIYYKLANAIQRAPEGIDRVALLWSVIDKMEDKELKARVGGPIFESLILEYGNRGKFADALRVFGTIDGPSDGPCLQAILMACGVARPPRWREALQILHTSDVVDDALGPGVMDAAAVGLAMNACSKANQPLEALKLLQLYGRKPNKYEKMFLKSKGSDVTSGVPVAAINSLISSCGRCGRPDLSMRVINVMEKSYGVKPDQTTYRSAVIVCNQAEHEKKHRESQGVTPRHGSVIQWWECSLSLLRRMQEEGLKPNVQIYSSVISACQAAGEWQRALGIFKHVVASCDGDMSRLNLYCVNAAISACEKGGAWVEGLDIFHRMPETGALRPDAVTINSMVEALVKADQHELALDTYRRGLQLDSVRPWRNTNLITGESVRALDLHQNSAAMASVAVRCVMEAVLEGNTAIHDNNEDLVIIVGKGKHSVDNISILGPLVHGLLVEEFGIVVESDYGDNGRIVIDSSVLKAFASRNQY